MEVIIVAIVMGLLGPLVLSILSNRQQHKIKEQDWARQDEVAERAAAAADAILEQSKQSTEITGQKLEVIRVDVNSNMTAAKQAELDATRRELLLMEELGRPIATLDKTKVRIAELEAQLNDRLEAATRVAEKEGRK